MGPSNVSCSAEGDRTDNIRSDHLNRPPLRRNFPMLKNIAGDFPPQNIGKRRVVGARKIRTWDLVVISDAL